MSTSHPLSLEDAELRLQRIEHYSSEVEAMLLIAQRTRKSLLDRQSELLAEQDMLRKRLSSRRGPGSSARVRNGGASSSGSSSSASSPRRASRSGSSGAAPSAAVPGDESVYDWVCEINKLSDVGTSGWQVRYSDRFLSSMSEDEQRYVVGIEPSARSSDCDDDAVSDSSRLDVDVDGMGLTDEPSGRAAAGKTGWDGAVVAVLGLFDKGKTFVLNHLTELDLPSGKKVSTKGLSFKHVNVEGTKFVVLDSEGSYAPVRVENELSVVEKELSERFIQDVIFELADYFLCVVNDFTSLDQRYLDKLTRSLQNSKKVFQEVIVVHNCKTVMERSVMQHIFESQIMHVYGRGKLQTTRIAALSRVTGELEEKDVQWFKTDFSRHVLLANEDCELGDRTNPWAFGLLKNWLRSAFVPVNRRFSVLQSVLQSCDARLSSYFRSHPELVVETTDDPRLKIIRARARQDEDQMRLQQTSVDATGLLLTRPNSFTPAIDIVQEKSYSILMDVPGMTAEDIRLSRQNVTTIVKGLRTQPYGDLQVQKVERQERTYGDFTQTFVVPQEYERRWHSVTVQDGVLRIVFKPDADEEELSIT